MSFSVPKSHPRYESLYYRHKIEEGFRSDVAAAAGLIAHGRGEAFDYLLGEKSSDFAIEAQTAAVAALLVAESPVISVNGNLASLVPEATVELAELTKAKLEINLFYYSDNRVNAIYKALEDAGAKQIYGLPEDLTATIPEIDHNRRKVDPRGILIADWVFVPLEDGDRTQALVKNNKKVITVDLNPLSRTAQSANVTIVNNIVRALPEMIEIAHNLKKSNQDLRKIIENYNNKQILAQSLNKINSNLQDLSKTISDKN
ncbi:MAG: phosphopantothenate/pantothenate synthetase [Spirochaetales bacterium]|nr:phosphopantothenate/pantothenate synthetase [Spirochaetales bacterium]